MLGAESWARISELCEQAIRDNFTPGCCVGVATSEAGATSRKAGGDGVGGQWFGSYGRLTYEAEAPAVAERTVYDLASITKCVPTALVIMRLAEDGALSLDDKVVHFIPELANQYRDELLIRHLLTYTAVFDLPQRMAEIAMAAPDRVVETILEAPLKAAPGKEFVYTNGPFLVLGLIAERIRGKPLDEIAYELFFGPLKMHQTAFRAELLAREVIAPTEIDWRGEVWSGPHDETAWIMRQTGKIPGFAGLFSSASDLLNMSQMLMGDGTFGGHHYFKPETMKLMRTQALPALNAHVGMGWRVAWPAIMGTQGSDQIFGKSGFSGCMLLVDPVKQRSLVVMANRTYPHRPADGDRQKLFGFWRSLADVVFAD